MRLNQSPHGGRRDEHHAQEQKAAPQENRGEKLVFLLPEPIPQDAEKPEEGDARERQKAQGERNGLGTFIEPASGFARVEGQRAPEQGQAANEQHGKSDARYGGRSRRPQPGVNQLRMWVSRIT